MEWVKPPCQRNCLQSLVSGKKVKFLGLYLVKLHLLDSAPRMFRYVFEEKLFLAILFVFKVNFYKENLMLFIFVTHFLAISFIIF